MKALAPLIVCIAAATACDKANQENSGDATKPGGAIAAATPEPEGGPAAPATSTQVLAAYEQVRAQLAADKGKEAVKAASGLSSKAAAASKTDAKHGATLGQIARAAGSLAKQEPGDIEAVRKAFGEVSRHLVALLEKDQGLRKGRQVFECPMAKGYKKWVQPTAKLENPYMGQAMLECGAETEWGS